MTYRRATPVTEDQMHRGLAYLLAKGYTALDLLDNPENVESLDWTTPGFVPWLREHLRG